MRYKAIYIAKFLGIENVNGSEIRKYETPKMYRFNIDQVEGYRVGSLTEKDYGANRNPKYKCVIPQIYEGVFNVGDLVYLEGAKPDGEKRVGANANYVLENISSTDMKICLYFARLTK